MSSGSLPDEAVPSEAAPRSVPIVNSRPPPPPTWASSEWRRLGLTARPLPVLLALAWLFHRGDSLPLKVVREVDRKQAILEVLRTRALVARAKDVHFVSPTEPLLDSPVERERALVRAAHPNEPHDIYLVDVRRSPEGHLIDLTHLYNLTRTSAADEQQLIVEGDRAAWTIAQDGAISHVLYADLAGEPAPQGKEWTLLARLQNAITNFQESGQFSGIGRRSLQLEPAAYRVVLGLSPSALLIDADAHKIRIPTGAGSVEGAQWVRDLTPKKARPGNLVTWAVDRVRGLSAVGDEYIAVLKAVAFQGVDQFQQVVGTVTGDDGSKAVAEELGELYAAPTEDATDPETGWPPPPMEPMLDPPLKGEGKWVNVTGFPNIVSNPGAPVPFVVSFIRTDKDRIYSQVFVTLWDPRQVELNAVSGTVEPVSATGATGTGSVPRDPRVLSSFVAAFNGGFQALHGEFGMGADGVVYLPPKPYGATVAKLADGSTGFGTWPEDPTVPSEIVSYRQNMTPLIQDERVNPYKRHWWGGTPPGWTEESRTVRSAICMTREAFIGYFYAPVADPDVLTAAMQRARCSYAIHLDMNAGHTGLEFYRVGPKGTLPEAPRTLQDSWEARGPMPDMPGWEFHGRLMIKFMALMNFPRYVNTEARDFFYLTLRHLLPGENLAPVITPAEAGEGAWRTQGLPQHGWPHAIATTNIRPDRERPFTRVGLIKLDPKYVRPARLGDTNPRPVIEFRSVLMEGPLTLWHADKGGFAIASEAPAPGAMRITSGIDEHAPEAARAQAALGIDPAGMLIYARVTEGPSPGKDGTLLSELLGRLECTQKLLLAHPLGAIIGERADKRDATLPASSAAPPPPPAPPGDGIRFIRIDGPSAKRIFPDTPIVPPNTWYPLQQKRIRYFKKTD